MREQQATSLPVPDEELVKRVQHGDREAFEELVRRHKRPIVNYVYRILGDYDKAVELSQETFLRVWANIERYEPLAKFTTWLYRIATNLAINVLRDSKRGKFYSLSRPAEQEEPDGALAEASVPDATGDPEERTAREEIRRMTRMAIASLPQRYRMMLVMRDLEELSYEEIAEITKKPLGTVKSRINRARLLLKEKLEPYLASIV